MRDDRRQSKQLVFRYILEERAASQGDKVFATFVRDGTTWTWAQLDSHANRMANALAGLGIGPGDVVAVVGPNSAPFLQTFFGTTKLGALIAPINPAFRGLILNHVLTLTQARVVVCEPESIPRLAEVIAGTAVEHIVIMSEDTFESDAAFPTTTIVSLSDLLARHGDDRPHDPGLEFWDPYGVIFTSGTTGPSKGVLSLYGQLHAMVEEPMLPQAQADDIYLVDLPLFHVGGLLSLGATLYTGASMVINERIQVEGYWDIVRRYGVTHLTFLPQVSTWLWKRPPEAQDSENSVRRLLIGQYFPNYDAWSRRFGIENSYAFYNMTEISGPIMHVMNPGRRETSGRARPGVELRLADDHDIEVPNGQPGQLLIRTDRPWEMNGGYLGMPEATVSAWRNGWFHTGDVFVQDDDGYYRFVDRVKDVIRRGGENVSSFEVEEATKLHDEISACAAISVKPSGKSGDEEIMIFVVRRDGSTLTYEQLISFLRSKLPYFMVPRYIEWMDELPSTANGKARKTELRARGIATTTWDRVAAGIVLSGKSDRGTPDPNREAKAGSGR